MADAYIIRRGANAPVLQAKSVTVTQNGTLNVNADSGYDGLSSVTANVNVTVNKPTLNAPTVSLAGDILTINNPSSNGNFVYGFDVYANGLVATFTQETTVDLSDYITTDGTYSVTVRAYNADFNDSPSSNAVTYSVVSGYTVTVYNTQPSSWGENINVSGVDIPSGGTHTFVGVTSLTVYDPGSDMETQVFIGKTVHYGTPDYDVYCQDLTFPVNADGNIGVWQEAF